MGLLFAVGFVCASPFASRTWRVLCVMSIEFGRFRFVKSPPKRFCMGLKKTFEN